jgi:hypothetical protein
VTNDYTSAAQIFDLSSQQWREKGFSGPGINLMKLDGGRMFTDKF